MDKSVHGGSKGRTPLAGSQCSILYEVFNGQTYAYFPAAVLKYFLKYYRLSNTGRWRDAERKERCRTEVRFQHGTMPLFYWRGKTQENELLSLFHVHSFCWHTEAKQFQIFLRTTRGSWRSHSRAGISHLRAATLSPLHLGDQPFCWPVPLTSAHTITHTTTHTHRPPL